MRRNSKKSQKLSSSQYETINKEPCIYVRLSLKCLLLFVVIGSLMSFGFYCAFHQALDIYNLKPKFIPKNNPKKESSQLPTSVFVDEKKIKEEPSGQQKNTDQIINSKLNQSVKQQSANKQQQQQAQKKTQNLQSNIKYAPIETVNENQDISNEHSEEQISKQQIQQFKKYQQAFISSLKDPSSQSLQHLQQLHQQEYQYYESKYHINQYQNELPICVVVPSYNNVDDDRYIKNIESILNQNYNNYQIVFIDDASEDKTGQELMKYLDTIGVQYSYKGSEDNDQESKQNIQIIINQERIMAMYNIRMAAIEYCSGGVNNGLNQQSKSMTPPSKQIFMIIDGDDFMIGNQVFKLFNAVFQSKGVWVAWTNSITITGDLLGYSGSYNPIAISNNDYRNQQFLMSHQRAYLTELFKRIKDEDLRDENGQYYQAANDVAIGLPILEMAHTKVTYIPEITYFYNMNTGLNNHKVRRQVQKKNQREVRNKPRYPPIEDLSINKV